MRIELVPRDAAKVHSTLLRAVLDDEVHAALADGRGEARAAVSCRIAARETRHFATRVRLQAFGEDGAPLPRSGRIGS